MTKSAITRSIDKGFIPGNYVQERSTGNVYKILDYPYIDNTILLQDNKVVFLEFVTIVETKPCCCKHKYFLGKVLYYPSPDKQTRIYNKTGDLYIECPHCCRMYFFNGVDWMDEEFKLRILD